MAFNGALKLYSLQATCYYRCRYNANTIFCELASKDGGNPGEGRVREEAGGIGPIATTSHHKPLSELNNIGFRALDTGFRHQMPVTTVMPV
jgi:hypothetical protein